MPELATDRTSEIKIKKMALANNRLDVAAEKVKHERVQGEMPWAIVQEHGANKLPGVGVAHGAIADAEIVAHETRLRRFQKKLRNKRNDIRAD